jgi:hypothetical protein
MGRPKTVISSDLKQEVMDIFEAQMRLKKKVNIREALCCIYGKDAEGGRRHALLAKIADHMGYPRTRFNAKTKTIDKPVDFAVKESFFMSINVFPDWMHS